MLYHHFISAIQAIFSVKLNCAKTYIDYHTQKFGYSQPNVEFVFGYIEKLGEAGLKEGSFDLIM